MTEQTVTPAPEQPQISQEPLTDDQMAVIRQSLVARLSEAYAGFTKLINSFPLNPHIKQKSLEFLDTGFLWAEKGLNILQLGQAAVVTPGAPVEQPAASDATPATDTDQAEQAPQAA